MINNLSIRQSFCKMWGYLFLVSIILLIILGCDKPAQKNALVTFQFDHPFITQYTLAKPLFDSKGIRASLMINTAEVGKSEYFMSWNQLKEMYDDGWEIGAHTVDHPDLREVDEETLKYELSRGKAILEAQGFRNIRNFAYPYGYYNLNAVHMISEYYRSARTSIAQTGFPINPENISPYELSSYECRLTPENVKDAYKYVDKAMKEGKWLIFLLHEFRSDAGTDKIITRNEISDIKAVEMLIDYIQKKNIPIVTTNKALDYFIGTE